MARRSRARRGFSQVPVVRYGPRSALGTAIAARCHGRRGLAEQVRRWVLLCPMPPPTAPDGRPASSSLPPQAAIFYLSELLPLRRVGPGLMVTGFPACVCQSRSRRDLATASEGDQPECLAEGAHVGFNSSSSFLNTPEPLGFIGRLTWQGGPTWDSDPDGPGVTVATAVATGCGGGRRPAVSPICLAARFVNRSVLSRDPESAGCGLAPSPAMTPSHDGANAQNELTNETNKSQYE